MKIDKINKKIIFELDKNSRIPERALAKVVGRSKESVRYRIGKLVESGIIKRFTTWIDPTKVGYQSAKIYVTLANIPARKKELISYIRNDKRLFWFAIAEGAWNGGLTFFVRDNEEFFHLKNDLFTRFKDLIIDSYTASLVSVHYYGKTYLCDEEISEAIMFHKVENNSLDEISIKILKDLFLDSRINIVSLANKHDTSVEIIRNRMKKMEEQRIIVRYTIDADFQKLGYDFYKTFLYFHNIHEDDLRKLMTYSKREPNVRFLVKQISPWDIELEVMARSNKEYNEIISRITEEFANIIRKVETATIVEDYIWPSKDLIFEG